MFSLNSIGCTQGPVGILEGNTTDRCMKANVLKICWPERFEVHFNQMKSKLHERQMNKEQSADDPSVDSIRVKNMLNSTISKELP